MYATTGKAILQRHRTSTSVFRRASKFLVSFSHIGCCQGTQRAWSRGSLRWWQASLPVVRHAGREEQRTAPKRNETGHACAAGPPVRASSSSANDIDDLGAPSGKQTVHSGGSFVEEYIGEDKRVLHLNDAAREHLLSLKTSIFRFSRAYLALFVYNLVDDGIQIWQNFYPGSLPLVTQPQYTWILNTTALINYWLCYYFLNTCGQAFVGIANREREDALPDILKASIYLTLTCNELTVVAWLFTLALTIAASMTWDGTKYFVGVLILSFAIVRVYGYALINKYYGELQDFVSAVLRDSKTPVSLQGTAPKVISKTDRVILKLCLGPLAVLGMEEEHELLADDDDGGYQFSDTDLEQFRSLSTAMFTTGVSYLVATSCTAVYYGALVAVGDDAEVVSALYSIPEYLSQLLTGMLLLETTDSFVQLVNGRPYISQFISACTKLDNVFVGLTNVTAAIIISNVFDLFWGDEFTGDIAVTFDLNVLQDAVMALAGA